MKPRAPVERASRDSWAVAGLHALAEGGVDAVAVEPVAKRLGVTKGSFYWHFHNRAELLDAVLDLWERRSTTEIIVELSRIDDPAERLRQLFHRVSEPARATPSHAALSSSHEPAVRTVLARVAAARLAFLSGCYEGLGMSAVSARRQAYLAYAAYLGMLQLAKDAPSEMVRRSERDAYTEHVIATLVPVR